MQQSTIFLISSDDLAWRAIRATVHEMQDVRIVGEATTATEAMSSIPMLAPDLVVLPGLIDGNPIRCLLVDLHRTCSSTTRFMVLAARLSPDDIPYLEETRLRGYLLWGELSCATLRHCLTMVLESDVIVASPTVVQAFIAGQRNPYTLERIALACLRYGITGRERDVLQLIALDLSYKEIGEKLFINSETVRSHTKHIAQKLGVESKRSIIIRMAHSCGLLENGGAVSHLVENPLPLDPGVG